MPFKSPFPDLDIPKTDLLSFLFPADKTPSTDPIWIDSQDPSISLSPAQCLDYVKKLASGLAKLGVKKGEVVVILTPNHIFVPVAMLGIIGGGYAFSGANPAYTVPGECFSLGFWRIISLISYRTYTPAQNHKCKRTAHSSESTQECSYGCKGCEPPIESYFPLLRLKEPDSRWRSRLAFTSPYSITITDTLSFRIHYHSSNRQFLIRNDRFTKRRLCLALQHNSQHPANNTRLLFPPQIPSC